ncbi:MAG TPA: hypothetical protein VLG71_00955, partial [Candidatus Limnocylindria bacterium]|nr:hypothetical protein [Candidatus Limnocylindria bacterium]
MMKIRNLIVASFLLAPFYLSAATTTADRVKSLARSAAPIVLPALAVGGASAAYIACLSPNAYKDLLFKHTSRATYLHILEMSGVNLDNMCSDDSTVEAAAYCEVQSYHAKAAG